MKIIINGDFSQGREQMKRIRAELTKDIRKIGTKLKNAKGYADSDRKEKVKLEKQIPVYSVSLTIPATYEGIVINAKVLERFVKKLKGFNISAEVVENVFVLKYENPTTRNKGELKLFDISSYFKGFNDIPELQIEGDFNEQH